MAIVLGRQFGFDPFTTPYEAMSAAARKAFLWGEMDVEVPRRNGKGPQTLHWRGVLAIIKGWDLGRVVHRPQVCRRAAAAGSGRVPRRSRSAA
jgi:hypothetical protein